MFFQPIYLGIFCFFFGVFQLKEKIIAFYSKNYKKLLVIPLAFFILTAFLAFVFPGVPKGIDFEGGTLIIVRAENPVDAKQAEQLISANFDFTELSVTSISSPTGYGLTIRFADDAAISSAEQELSQARQLAETNPSQSLQHSQSAVKAVSRYVNAEQLPSDAKEALDAAEKIVFQAREKSTAKLQELIFSGLGLGKNAGFQKQEVSPTLGKVFFETAVNVSIFSIILLVIVVFVLYREIVPSLAIVASMVFDVVFALGLMALFRIPLTLSSIPALLMLAGYSIDTDILLTTRMLARKEGNAVERAFDSMKTGMLMTLTALGALLVMLVFGFLNQVTVLYSIAAVLLFGLLGDPIATWIMNTGILMLYLEKKQKRQGA